MGETPKKVRRVVLDTNVLVSALLFTGKLSKIVDLWRQGKVIPLISRGTFEELRAVLEYPKFSLAPDEIQSIIENEILPFFEVVEIQENVRGVCRDPGDDKFIACALSAPADFLVSGDKDLTDLKRYKTVKIIRVSEFLSMYE
ncbi:MAG: putative toxin-antitoxin system toxin component, PIN family [Deltaproteobacteria bacterium]|nr:putative toxin-antitoxin system toxin component, PIN family [Deltaproteobacteria bacterium]